MSKGKVLLEQRQGMALRMPRLEGRTCALIDAYNLKYSTAQEDKRLTIADRSRVHRWVKAMDRELDKASQVLGMAEENHPRAHRESARSATG